jgi:hypothetical protein
MSKSERFGGQEFIPTADGPTHYYFFLYFVQFSMLRSNELDFVCQMHCE